MATHLTWEQKLAALMTLSECSLMMRKPGDWYVHDHIEVASRGLLASPTESEPTPEMAVNQHWAQLVHEPGPGAHLYVTGKGLRVRWTGFMWETVDVAGGAS